MKLNRIAGVLMTTMLCLSSALEAADNMTSTKLNGCKGPVLCSSFPLLDNCDECCKTWHLDVGLLYQQPIFAGNSAGLGFSPIYAQSTATSAAYVDQNIQGLNVCLDYALGLTVSAGYLMQHDQWFVSAKFDWLSSSGGVVFNGTNTLYVANPLLNITASVIDSEGIFIGTGFNPETDPFDSINYNSSLDFYGLDVMLSRGSFHSRCFSYDPWMGVEAIWFTRKQNAASFSTTLPSGTSAVLNIQRDSWGAGPTFGFNGEYHITEGLSLFSDSNVAVLIGQLSGTTSSTLTASGATGYVDPRVATINTPESCAFMVPLRSIIGVKLSTFCLEDKHYVAIKLGYDARAVGVVGPGSSPAGFSLNGLYTDLIWNF